jgi:hypothetical protein
MVPRYSGPIPKSTRKRRPRSILSRAATAQVQFWLDMLRVVCGGNFASLVVPSPLVAAGGVGVFVRTKWHDMRPGTARSSFVHLGSQSAAVGVDSSRIP